MSRRLTARLGHDDGQTTVLTVGLCAVLVALMLVMLAVTTVQLQHRRLQSLADSAAIAGAEELGFRLGEDPGVVLSDDVAASASAHLAAVGAQEAVPGLGGMNARVAEDGSTVVVTLDARADLFAMTGPFAGTLPLSVPLEATGSSRTSLAR
ncbi:pilus assembly protein TadG-related protein [Micrococcus sp. KRD077]|uniref:pilus assembly protein TadG-related protein n=1 Tax=Micrococcus sp. KRD077 TaxID=2729720 RepID=UPI0019D2E7DA|nr:pilus assembly protein TadG-related protein [Micrococcus sp. KRD077]